MKRILALMMMCCLACLSSWAGHDSILKAGTARENITPPASLFPFLAAHEEHPYTGIHDSLYVRALVMEADGQRAVLMELDEVAIPDADSLRQLVAQAAGTTASHVMMTVNHTHSTLHPHGGDSKVKPDIDKIFANSVKAAREAASHLEPVSVAFARTQAYANVNNGEVEQSKGQYANDAFSDKTLDVVRFQRRDSSVLALVVNYATHAEVMFRSVTRDGGYEITGDLPGRVASLLESQYAGSVVLTTPSAEGDQQPLFTSKQRTETQGTVDQGVGGWSIVDVQARRIVDAVNVAVGKMGAGETNTALQVDQAEAVVPGAHRHRMSRSGRMIDESAPDVHISLMQIRLGDIAFRGVGADLASEMGVAAREASATKNTMLISCINNSVGYVLSDETYRHYTHGVMGSPVKPGYARQAILSAFQNMDNTNK
jgi:neutral ceramidase